MNTLLVIINVIIMLLLVGVLYYMQQKHHSFNKRVFTALGLGIIFGLILQLFYKPTSEVIIQSNNWFNLIGSGYVKLLQMIVMPLILVSIISAFTKLKLLIILGKLAVLLSVFYFLQLELLLQSELLQVLVSTYKQLAYSKKVQKQLA